MSKVANLLIKELTLTQVDGISCHLYAALFVQTIGVMTGLAISFCSGGSPCTQKMMMYYTAGRRISSKLLNGRYGLSGLSYILELLHSRICGLVETIYQKCFVYFQGTRTQWRHALYLGAGLSVAGAATFIIFGSAEVQPWATSGGEKSRNSVSVEMVPLETKT